MQIDQTWAGGDRQAGKGGLATLRRACAGEVSTLSLPDPGSEGVEL